MRNPKDFCANKPINEIRIDLNYPRNEIYVESTNMYRDAEEGSSN